MKDQDRLMIATAEDVKSLSAEVRALREMLTGAMIVPPPEWLTLKQAAAAMGVSVDTVRRRIDAGVMEAKGSGKMRRVKVPYSSRLANSAASAS